MGFEPTKNGFAIRHADDHKYLSRNNIGESAESRGTYVGQAADIAEFASLWPYLSAIQRETLLNVSREFVRNGGAA